MHKPNDITKAKVSALSSFGVAQERIADYLGITRKTLAKHYDEELKNGKTDMIMNVGLELRKLIRQGDFRAIKFYLERVAGWGMPENTVAEQEDEAKGPINEIEINVINNREDVVGNAS